MPDFCSPGAPNLILYDSEVQVVKGEEYLKSMKLSAKSPNRRIYSTSCGTPMGISPDKSGTTMIYLPNIRRPVALGTGEVAFPDRTPSVCLYHDRAMPGKSKPPPETKLVKGIVAPRFIGQCISRLALLSVLGEKLPGGGFPVVGDVANGIESIGSS